MKRKVFLFVVAEGFRPGAVAVSIALFVVMFSVCGLLYPMGLGYFWMMGSAIFLALLSPSFALIGHYWAKRKIAEFREAFRIPDTEFKESAIDAVLASRAIEMSAAFESQNEIEGRIRKGLKSNLDRREIESVLIRSTLVMEARKRSAECKKRFWEAHALAALMGYETKESFKDHLVSVRC